MADGIEGRRTVFVLCVMALAALAPLGGLHASSPTEGGRAESRFVATGTTAETADVRQEIDPQAKRAPEEIDRLQQLVTELRRERDLAEARAEDVQRRLQTMHAELISNRKALADAQARMTALEKDREQLTAQASELRDQARDLTTKLSAEQVKSAALREDKQRLMAGTTTAKEEIARLQKRAGELETEAARAQDLAKRLAERDQEIARLRKMATEREGLSVRMAALTDKLERTKQRVATLTGELALLGEEAARMRQERDRLSLAIQRHQESLQPAGGDGVAEPPRPQPDDPAVRERPPRGESTGEIGTTGLPPSLQADIASGAVALDEGGDTVTIMLTDRVLFHPGDATLSARGQATLQQIGDLLKPRGDRQIRVEGHTDNVPIGPRVRDRYPTNWELSVARATTVVRYLVEEAGLDPSQLAASGYADTRPVASNDTEEGRMSNRRIEIIVSPKDQTAPSTSR